MKRTLCSILILAIGIAAARRFTTRAEWKLSLAIGLASVVLLFVLVYLQPALWLRSAGMLLLGGLLVLDIRKARSTNNLVAQRLEAIR